MPTIIGVIFLVCGGYCFFLREDGLFGLLILASAFEASSAINIADRGIQPYYVIAVLIILRALIKWSLGIQRVPRVPCGAWLLLFGLIAIGSAFILPLVFAGVAIYDPKIGIDDGLFIRPPLRFGLNNLGQAGFLACHIATAYSIPSLQFSFSKTRRAYLIAFYIIAVVIIAQSLFQGIGIPFPDSLIRNNPGYAITDSTFGVSGTRNSGTCTEPSIAGAFLVLFGCGFFADYLTGKGGIWKVLLALIGSGLVASSGSLVTIGVITPLLLLRFSPFKTLFSINRSQLRRYLRILLAIVIPLFFALLSFSGFTGILTSLVFSKGSTSSFLNRTTADVYALRLLADTHWIGVGLGSNRSSSFLTSMLSNVGVAGTLTFGVYFFTLFLTLHEDYLWLKWAAFALLLNMCIGIPDVTMPLLWIPILLATQHSSLRRQDLLGGSIREELLVCR